MKHTIAMRTIAGFALLLPACRGDGADDNAATAGLDSGDDGVPAGEDDGSGGSDDGDGDDDAGDDAPGATICDGLTFDNVVDEAACPQIQGENVEPPPADSVEFCRRAFIDLLGEAPTDIEFEQECKWKEPDEIVDAFMNRPEYVLVNQRMWGDTFAYTSELVHHQYIADLDALVGQVYQGTLSYDDFATIAATHPAFLGRWDGVDLVGFNFLAFLGRDANPAEREALEPLWHLWSERDVAHPNQTNARTVVLDTLQCFPNQSGCNSTYWGDQTVIVPPPVPGDTDPNGPNVIDQANLQPGDWDVLRTPGRLITEQETFYEAYVDRALRKYLGYDAGAELPQVRQALVDLMESSGGNVRVVEREILTSILYQATNEYEEEEKVDPADFDPPYWHGPVKQMDAEDWLRTAAKLTGVDLGSCDHRYPVVQSGGAGLHPHGYPVMDGGTAPDYQFRDMAQLLGGCPDHVAQFREVRTGLIAALTQATLTTELCAMADATSPIYPLQFVEDPTDKSEEALEAAADQIYSAAVVKPIPEGAYEGLAAGIDGCRDDTECLPEHFAIETCRLTLKAADFLFY
jgi:hypothetical protein